MKEVIPYRDKLLKSNIRRMATNKFLLQHNKEFKEKTCVATKKFSVVTIKAKEL